MVSSTALAQCGAIKDKYRSYYFEILAKLYDLVGLTVNIDNCITSQTITYTNTRVCVYETSYENYTLHLARCFLSQLILKYNLRTVQHNLYFWFSISANYCVGYICNKLFLSS